MSIERHRWLPRGRALPLALALWVAGAQALAQGVPPGAGGPPAHDPNGIPQLPQRSDVLPWSVLTNIKLKDGPKGPRPRYNAEQLALNGTVQRVQGFMMPLEPGQKQKHFLLSAVPLSCPFCMPGGPESMVEVSTSVRVNYEMEPMVVEGKLSVLADDPMGIYYRMDSAKLVK